MKKFKKKSSSKSSLKTKTKHKCELAPKYKLKSKKKVGKAKPKTKPKTKKSRTGYQRGALGKAIFDLFDKYGVDKVTFAQALKAAQKAKPDTTYSPGYFSWSKNDYRNKHDM